jgi:hypothetical protein
LSLITNTLCLVTPVIADSARITEVLQRDERALGIVLFGLQSNRVREKERAKTMSETARQTISEETAAAMSAAGDGANRRESAGRDGFNWGTAIAMGLFHVGAIAALFFFTWPAFFVALFLWWVSGSLGIGMSYHRLLTHRGYKTPKWVEYFLTWCATAFIISFRTKMAIRILPTTASGGRTWVGS